MYFKEILKICMRCVKNGYSGINGIGSVVVFDN